MVDGYLSSNDLSDKVDRRPEQERARAFLDLVPLRTFVAVADELHLTRAAERLHISQSAASNHVRAVEEALCVQLFVRGRRGLELTRHGHFVLSKAKALLSEATHFASATREMCGKLEGTLIVGVNSEPSASRIAKVIAELRVKHPMLYVDLRARPSLGTRQSLKTGEIDIGIFLANPIRDGFSHTHLTNLRYCIAGPAEWKTQLEHGSWGDLAAMPWITPASGSFAHNKMLDELFEERGLILNSVVRYDSAALARDMLRAGVGLMLLREEHALQALSEGRIAISPLAHIEFPLYLEHLTSRRDDPLIRAFVEAVAVIWPSMRPEDQPLHA